MTSLQELVTRAKSAAGALAVLSSAEKNRALHAIADALEARTGEILTENDKDIAAARQNGMSAAMTDRLRLTEDRMRDIADSVRYVAGLEDPVGRLLDGHTAPNGMRISRVTVPMGVVGIIFESRPNVTVDCAVLCLKSGNACVLRGGKEAIFSNAALARVMRETLAGAGLDPEYIQLVEDTSREAATAMMRMNGMIDILIPRGGPGLIASVVQNATVPVIETGVGNCHALVDATADLEMAADIVDNGKTSRPSVCNALETLLVHKSCAEAFLPMLAARFGDRVELRGCPETVRILGGGAVPVTEQDYASEFGDYTLAVRVVDSLDEALDHIAKYSTHHSEVIVTRDMASAQRFCDRVDSAAVYVNVSTRFTDGGQFGLGAEIGISTQKLHARGPMGLEHLTSYKYIVRGDGQIRA